MPPGAKILIPRWIQLVGLPLVLLFLWVVAGAVKHVAVPVHRRAADRALLRPDRPGLQPRAASAGLRRRRRLPRDRCCVVIAALAVLGTVVVTQSKHAANRFDDYFTKVHPDDAQDRRRPGRRPAPALAEHAQPERDPRPAAGSRPGQEDPGQGRRQVHAQDRHLPRGRRDLGRQARVRPRPDRRDLDLHAARDAEVGQVDRQALPAAAGSQPLLERMSRAVVGYVKGQSSSR